MRVWGVVCPLCDVVDSVQMSRSLARYEARAFVHYCDAKEGSMARLRVRPYELTEARKKEGR